MCWLFINCICPDLIELVSLETICSESSTEATTSIESDGIRTYSESLGCPVTIDDEFISCIVLIPGFSIIFTYECRYLWWCCESMVWMDSSVNNYKIIMLYNTRQWSEPIEISILVEDFFEWLWFFFLCMDPFSSSLTQHYSAFIYISEYFFIRERKVFMIPNNTPCIRTMTDKFDDFEGFWSLIDEVSDEVEIIFISYPCVLHECHELIITSMYIPDEKCSFLHVF